MKSYIKAIIIFNENGEKRIVPLAEGVNIITGESKTGKSALVEIIDYCLCSTRCTIPKGKITDFGALFSLVMAINEHTYVIARENWNSGGKMYFSKENIDFNPDELELSYFKEQTPVLYKNVQYEIECALGLRVTNLSTETMQQSKKASLRNMVSYMFQHQNLIASKFALFYRFSDYYKRKDVIEQFPVFAGIIGQEYYSDLIQLDSLKNQLKQKRKIQEANEKSIDYIRLNLAPLLADYYALLDLEFDNKMSARRMLSLAADLPEYDDAKLIREEKIAERYSKLESDLEELRAKERDILLKIKNIDRVSDTGNEFTKKLVELEQQTNEAKITIDKYVCPICGQGCKSIAEKDVEIVEATEWLANELALTERYTVDFSEDVRKLREIHNQIKEQIKVVWKQLKTLENSYISSKALRSKKEKINYAKAKITLFVEMYDTGLFENKDQEIETLRMQIRELEEKIKRFEIEHRKALAQKFITENMNRISENLDFEEEYRPINLNFGLLDNSFDLYQCQKNGEKIHLYEMGSGANWVSCHIALFLSLLRFFAGQDNSPMPLILFFDQPSQVYFPQGQEDKITQADLKAVNKMYKTIFDEINSIGSDTGIMPQIIIVDHVDGNDLENKDEFESYVRRNWRNGDKLI